MKKKIKIVKGLMFFAIAILFLFITFYNINNSVYIEDFNRYFDFESYIRVIAPSGVDAFGDYFAENKLNIIFTVLFSILGILEIMEVFTDE